MFTKKTFRKGFDGFSLIELLLVLSLAPVVFFAVYSNFVTGVRLWQRLQVGTPQEDAALFLIKARDDFNNAMRYTPMPFQGGEDEISFVCAIESASGPGGARAIGQVRYYYDAPARSLMRETRDYSQAYQNRTGSVQALVRNLRSFSALYLVHDPLASKYVWTDSFAPKNDPSNLPLAVRLTFEPLETRVPVEHTLFLPAGGAVS